MKLSFALVFLTLGLISCNRASPTEKEIKEDRIIQGNPDDNQIPITEPSCPMEDSLTKMGLVRVKSINAHIKEQLPYTGIDNFVGVQLYDCLDEAFLQKEVALMLDSAYKVLNVLHPGCTFLIWDAARPKSVQQRMWDSLKMPFEEKMKYVSNPKNHSVHNYGCAVDLTIIDSTGNLLDMGTEFDHFGLAANIDKDSINLVLGNLTKKQISNRWLLKMCMYKAGFTGINSEWWHFNGFSRAQAKNKYKLLY